LMEYLNRSAIVKLLDQWFLNCYSKSLSKMAPET